MANLDDIAVFDGALPDGLYSKLAELHAACITIDGQELTFMPPLDHSRITKFWQEYAADPKLTVLVQLRGDEPLGVVVLRDSGSETGPFRGDVLKLMVSPNARRLGLARKLMAKLELVAEERGLTLLVLDTAIGLPAEHMYPKLGWTRIGVIPGYCIHPWDGRFIDELWFYKELPSHRQRYGKPRDAPAQLDAAATVKQP